MKLHSSLIIIISTLRSIPTRDFETNHTYEYVRQISSVQYRSAHASDFKYYERSETTNDKLERQTEDLTFHFCRILLLTEGAETHRAARKRKRLYITLYTRLVIQKENERIYN
jgi:hypothetical protein